MSDWKWYEQPPDIESFQFRWSHVPKQIYLHNYDHPRSHLMYSPFMTLVRKPLLAGTVPTWGEYLTAGAIAAGLFALAITLLGRMQKKLIFHL